MSGVRKTEEGSTQTESEEVPVVPEESCLPGTCRKG